MNSDKREGGDRIDYSDNLELYFNEIGSSPYPISIDTTTPIELLQLTVCPGHCRLVVRGPIQTVHKSFKSHTCVVCVGFAPFYTFTTSQRVCVYVWLLCC